MNFKRPLSGLLNKTKKDVENQNLATEIPIHRNNKKNIINS